MTRALIERGIWLGAALLMIWGLASCATFSAGDTDWISVEESLSTVNVESEAGKIAYLANDGGYWQVWVCTPGGDQKRQITSSAYEKSSISWFPDGRRILVHALSGRLFVVDVATGMETSFSANTYDGHDAVVSPDGRNVAVSASLTPNPDTNEILLVDVEGGNRTILPSVGGAQYSPAWSRDGRWIYFVSPSNSKLENNIWRIQRDGLQIEQLTIAAAYHFDVDSSSAAVIAYSSNESGDYEIWSWNLDANERPRRLTKRDGFDGDPAWSPSGERIVYVSRVGTSSTLRILNSETGDSVALASHTNGARAPIWNGRAK